MKMHGREMVQAGVQVDNRHESQDSLPRTSYSSSGLHFCRRMMCNALAGFCHRYLPMILLMRSGDVETNPGPERTVSDEEFINLSRQIGPYYYKDVGVHLEIGNAELDQIIAQHMLNYGAAFLAIFMKWRDKQQPGTDIRALLAERLERSGLRLLSGALLAGNVAPDNLGEPVRPPDTQTQPAESQIKPLSPELVERCAKDFKFKYRSTLCKIRADPLNPASLVGFKKLYTNLELEKEDGSGRENLDYNDLLNLEVNGEFPKRILVQGEAGAGKTTFCKKIAWDWLEGRYFKNHVWVLIVPLREFQQHTIGQIAKSYLTKDNPATPSQLTHYIRSNQDKVFIAFDGLDEFRGEIIQEGKESTNSECHQSPSTDQMQHQSSHSSSDTMQASVHTSDTCESPSPGSEIEVMDIIRSDQLEACPVLVTTRTWKAAEIRSDNHLMNLYSFIHVKGFSRENLSEYIHKYFPDDEVKAGRLFIFTLENDAFSEHFAQYPIYVAMLCLMWKTCKEQDLEEMKSLETFSQIFSKMSGFLKEHYAQKEIKKAVGKSLNTYLKEINELLKPVAELALSGLLHRNLIFSEDDFKRSPESMDMACRVGLLSQENRITPSGDGDDEETSHMECTIFFPHRLFQEYMAGVHFASLYKSDRHVFDKLMKEVVLPRKEEFRYLLCFAVSRNKVIAKHVMECLMQDNAEMEKDMDLLVAVAWESQDKDVAALLKNRVFSEQMLLSMHLTPHTAAGYIYTGLYPCASNFTCSRTEFGPIKSVFVAMLMCRSRHLFGAILGDVVFCDCFFAVLAREAKDSKVQVIHLEDVKCPTPASSRFFAEALCSMPNVTHLTMREMYLSEEFCSSLKAKASAFQGFLLRLLSVKCPLPASSRDLAEALCSMPNLGMLYLDAKDLKEEFYSALKAKGSTKKVYLLDLEDVKLPTPASSKNLVEALCSMPRLISLSLFHPQISGEFCSKLKAKASALTVEHLHLFDFECPSPAASQHLAEALCSMPNLTNLTLNVMDASVEFCSTLKAKASTLKVESVNLDGIKCPTPAASQNLAKALCSMPNLTDLTLSSEKERFHTLYRLELHEEFYITLKAMASMQGCFPHTSRGDFKFNGILQENLDSFLHSLADFQRECPPIRTLQPPDHSQQQPMGDVQPSDHCQQQPMDDVQLVDLSQQQPMGDVQLSDHPQQQPMDDVQLSDHSQQQPISGAQPSRKRCSIL